ncbi:hypothetical protein KIN20_033587 [Parelaphostrongylus tenuis]|uniref:Uncharacterized protein n=1 Tax=Parelaphostrongylus tenuis TaxID=148309 RepID=A0AAD5R8P0_PARTN|nr:hypothetical protein KIN20_033587 [Parelaphostrongylus tenuis]
MVLHSSDASLKKAGLERDEEEDPQRERSTVDVETIYRLRGRRMRRSVSRTKSTRLKNKFLNTREKFGLYTCFTQLLQNLLNDRFWKRIVTLDEM